MNKTIRGQFDVVLAPQAPAFDDSGLGRMSLSKQFHGELNATSHGEMLSFRSSTPGSAGYVAMERVNGTLCGQGGTFVLQHSGTMTRGTPALTLTVVPDSGTASLSGLTGSMAIEVVEGKHFYTFDFGFEAEL